jgi:hypothetical protein
MVFGVVVMRGVDGHEKREKPRKRGKEEPGVRPDLY